MRKGNKFEAEIKKVLDWVNASGGHAHKNNPNRTIDGIFVSGEPFDFEIFYKNYHACFDAKEIKGDTWHLLKKDIVQAENLKHCKNNGLRAFFLIFNNNKVKQLDVDSVVEHLKQNKKSLKLDNLPEWDFLKYIGGEINYDNRTN